MEGIETDLDALSNSVLDAIDVKNYAEAEKRCQRLLIEYPEVVDGHLRLGKLREVQERFQEAAEQYSKALEMMKQQPGGFEQETIRNFTEKRDRMLARLK